MSTKFAAMPRLVVCTAIVGAMVFGLYGCAKKEAEQAESTEAMPTEEVATPATDTGVAGVYVAEVTGTETAGQKISLALNEDSSATMTVEFMNNQPAVVQSGSWEMGEGENIVNFMYGGEASTMTLSFSMMGDELHMMNEEAAGFGATEIALVKQAHDHDPHAGHQH